MATLMLHIYVYRVNRIFFSARTAADAADAGSLVAI